MSTTVTAEAPQPAGGRETRSWLLTIPTEIRLQIYAHLLPTQRVYLNACNAPSGTIDPGPGEIPSSQTGSSAVLSYLTSIHLFNSVVKSYGLPLLQACTRTNAEMIPLLRTRIFRFHCTRCFTRFLEQFAIPTFVFTHQSQFRDRSGSGSLSAIARRWLRHVEIELDLDERCTLPAPVTNERTWLGSRHTRAMAPVYWHTPGHTGRYSHTMALAVMDGLKGSVRRAFGMSSTVPRYENVVKSTTMDWDRWGYTILKKRWPDELAELESRGDYDGAGAAAVDGNDLLARVPLGYLSSKMWLIKIDFHL